MKRAIIVGLLLLGMSAVSRGAKADDSAFWGNGVNVYPVQETSISMEYELLNVDVTNEKNGGLTARVDVLFIFRNAGPEKTITMGFPEWSGGSGDEDIFIPTIHGFQATVDGIPVDTVAQLLYERNDDFDFERVHLWRVHFSKGQTRTVRNSYWYSASASATGEWHVGYILKTGALWAGPIGRIDIFVKARQPVMAGWGDPENWMSYVPYPEEYSEFHAIGWEPVRDIRIGSNSHYDDAIYNREYCNYPIQVAAADREKVVQERRELIRSHIAGLGKERLSTCSKHELQEYINGIYATYGRVFVNPEWAKFFKAKWWYDPDPSFKDSMLTAQDQKTITRLQQYVAGALETQENP